MIVIAAATLATGLAALASPTPNGATRRRRRMRVRLAGWLLIGLSGFAAVSGDGWMGLMSWIGLVPVAGGAIMLDRSYRPKRAAGSRTSSSSRTRDD